KAILRLVIFTTVADLRICGLACALACWSRTCPWGGARPRGYSRGGTGRCAWRRGCSWPWCNAGCNSRAWGWPRPCRSQNGTRIANDSTGVSIGKRHIVQNIEGTAALFNPVISSIYRPDDRASFTDGGSIIYIRKRNIPQMVGCFAALRDPVAAAIGCFENGTAIPNHCANVGI